MNNTLRHRTGKGSKAAGRRTNATGGPSSSSKPALAQAVSSRFDGRYEDSENLKQATWRKLAPDPTRRSAGFRWLNSRHWRLLACATLVALVLSLPSLTSGHLDTAINAQSGCVDSAWDISFERFLDFWGFDNDAHQAALEEFGDTDPLQELRSSHAKVGWGLSGTVHLVRRLGCSIRAYASAESEGSRRELIEEIRYQNRELEALLAHMSRLRNIYQSISWKYSALNRTTAAAADNSRVGTLKLLYLCHESILLNRLFRSLGQDVMESWRETSKAKKTQEVVDLGLSTHKAELQLLDRLHKNIAKLNSNANSMPRELPPEKGFWAKFWHFCQSFSEKHDEPQTREDYWRQWYRYNIVENLLLLDSEKIDFRSLPSCSWGLRLNCE